MTSLSSSAVERLRRFVRALRKRDELWSFFQALNDNGEAFLFGGAPRDIAFGLGSKVHDLDIFVSGLIDIDEMSKFSSVIRKTNFGGLRLFVGSFEVDAWELQKSYAFRTKGSYFVSTRNLLRSVCFSTDGIAVSLKSGQVSYTQAFRKSLETHRLDFVSVPVNVEAVIGARIARLALKLNLELSGEVATYLLNCLANFGSDGLVEAEARWGVHRMLNPLLLEQLRSQLSDSPRDDIGL